MCFTAFGDLDSQPRSRSKHTGVSPHSVSLRDAAGTGVPRPSAATVHVSVSSDGAVCRPGSRTVLPPPHAYSGSSPRREARMCACGEWVPAGPYLSAGSDLSSLFSLLTKVILFIMHGFY